MAYFIRTRRLDLKRLERKPQENLAVVHAILKSSVKEVVDKLHHMERNFYGTGKSAMDEIRKWSGAIKSVISSAQIGFLTGSWQIEQIIKHSNEPNTNFTVDMYDLNKLKECHRKIRNFVPSKFTELVNDARTVLKYLQKYCLSFYDSEEDLALDTAKYYEKQRQTFQKTIRTNLDNIISASQKFNAVTSGFNVSDLNSHALDLARRTDCTSIPFLFLFPHCCENIKIICECMTSWIQADENYSEYLKNDAIDLDSQKESSLKSVRVLQQKYHQMGFRQHQIVSECEKFVKEIDKLTDKEVELMIQEEELKAETNDIQVDIEMKEYRRDELIKNAMNLHPNILYERYSEISENLRDLKRRLPYARREMHSVTHKLEWISAKQTELRQMKKKLREVETEMEVINQQKQEQEVEHDSVLQHLELVRKLLLYKNCPDSMEKIFNERPVQVNKARLPGQRGKDDPFDRACDVVAVSIENDWSKLYRALPFHPNRGHTTVDRDIQNLLNSTSRMSLEDLAIKCLHRWRRFHTRAKLEDIYDALNDIKRFDVLQKVQQTLNPTMNEEEEEEEKITYAEAYLIPFIKQVERFDELRAANKI